MALEMRKELAKIIILRAVGLKDRILPKMSENKEPRVQGMRSNLPVVTQSMLKRLTMRSFRLVYKFITIQLPRMAKLTNQNSRGICSKQLTLNYSYYYYSSQLSFRASSSFLRFYFLLTIQEMTKAAIIAKKSTKLAMYQGREIDLVDQQIIGVTITLIESTIQGTHNPKPISISKYSAPYRAITNPCIVKAEEPAMPTIALKTYTMQMNPSGFRSNRIAVRSQAVKLVTAITITVFWRGKRSKMSPRGISVKMMGRLQEMYSQLNQMEVRLQGSYLRGTSKA